MSEETYADAILKYLSSKQDSHLKPRQVARQMGVADQDYGTFRAAVKQLRDDGRVVMGEKNALMLPEMGNRITGFYRQNPKGFGFVIPDNPNAHGDLYIAKEDNGGAMTGDQVVATVHRQRRDGKTLFRGRIVEILQRGQYRFVGKLEQTNDMHFIVPEGKRFNQPILLRDVGEAGPPLGTKVVVEIVDYGGSKPGDLPSGVIMETLGPEGRLEVETRAIVQSYGLQEEFSDAAMDFARQQVRDFDPDNLDHEREDVTALRIATIDPPDARDYDDAISIETNDDGTITLGVHIADVAHFVQEGSPLDEEAKKRSTSVYFPRRVIPMLPVNLSNGVCSLQEGQTRLTKSVFITYDKQGKVVSSRLAETIIRSMKRLTYEQAQTICEKSSGKGGVKGFDDDVVSLVKQMESLARSIEKRRRKEGMLHLDLPAIELVLDEQGKVVDAEPEDDSYTHTIIEMFMVEANEAVARELTKHNQNFLRRIHPDPDADQGEDLAAFIKGCGVTLPQKVDRFVLQDLLERVKGKPESYAVNLAVLKTFQQAQYSPMRIGHFALASDDYCHFTSPIRRYPDLTVHRLVAKLCRGQLNDQPAEDLGDLTALGDHCSTAERRAEAAENELRDVLVLQLMETKLGQHFEGIITGVANFGLFVQWPKYLVEGLIRLENLGDDWWEVDAKQGIVRGEATGKTYRLGDKLKVQITNVDVARRQLDLLPEKPLSRGGKNKRGGGKKSSGQKKKNANPKKNNRGNKGRRRKKK
jgi:ribonuclease R